MEIRYRLHRLLITEQPAADGNRCPVLLRIISADGYHLPTLSLVTEPGIDRVYRSAFERGLSMVDDACDSRLTNPLDEVQPRY